MKKPKDERPGFLLQAMRKNFRGGPSTGRPPTPTFCRRCGEKCPSAKLAWAHCKPVE